MSNSPGPGSGDNEIEDEEVFEITDFTNATDWEKFVTQVEETITDWQLSRYVRYRALDVNELTTGEWETKSANLSFSSVPFVLTLHRLKQKEEQEKFVEASDPDEEDFHLPQFAEDFMNLKNDFPARAHCIARWYGLRCFMVLSPLSSNGIQSVSKCKLLQSSGSIALNNTTCDVPFFIQIQENWRRMYAGCGISSGMQTSFQIVHLKKCPIQYQHLSGLLYVFKSHLHQASLPSENCEVSARFTYILNEWGSKGVWPIAPIDSDTVASQFKTLSGCLEDPVAQLHLAAQWSSITGDMITDDDIHSDFDPLKAPDWSIRLCYTDDVQSLLNCYLQELINISDRTETIAQLVVQRRQSLQPENDMSQALERITDPHKSAIPLVSAKLASGISKVVSDPQGFLKKGAYQLGRIAISSASSQTISEDVLQDVMKFLFCGTVEHEEKPNTFLFHHKLKAAPISSITHRLAICAMVVNLCHGGIRALAQMWHAFVTELRRLLDTSEILPGIGKSTPDLRTCLLHQKLHMLNYCINCKINRESMLDRSIDKTIPTSENQNTVSSPTKKIEKVVFKNGSVYLIPSETDVIETDTSANILENKQLNSDEQNIESESVNTCVEDCEKLDKTEAIVDAIIKDEDPKENCSKIDNEIIETSNQTESSEDTKTEDQNINSIAVSVTEPLYTTTEKEKVSSKLSLTFSEEDSEDEFFECESSIDGSEDEQIEVEDNLKEEKSIEQMQMETEIFTEKIIDEIKSMDSTVEIENESEDEDQCSPEEEDTDLPAENNEILTIQDQNDEEIKDVTKSEDTEMIIETENDEINSTISKSEEVEIETYPAEGRLKPFGNMNLLKIDTPLYIPITQDHAPLTEDQLEEQASIFAKLGDTKEGSNLRARMQSASLSSDMESFRAANPGCVLEDFVRWYSPRDFENGVLSQRMEIPDNLWVTTWKAAKPIPAHRQKRLFNDTKEAEKVLHFLTNLKPSEVTQLLLPVCIHEAILNLKSSSEFISDCLPSLSLLCNQIESKAGQIFHSWRMSGSIANQFNAWTKEQKAQFQDLVRQITFAECLIERARSLQHKFSSLGSQDEVQKFVRKLLEHPEVKLTGGPNGKEGRIVKEYFETEQKLLHQNTSDQMSEFVETSVNPLPKPTGREFIIRTTASHPSFTSRKLPHRMYAVLMRNEFRIASAVSSDTIFF